MTTNTLAGPPELVAEISASSVSYDLHEKLRAYQRNGVCEYLVWRVLDSAIDWFVLREGRFERLPLTDAGHYHSETFPGLWLDPAAVLRGDFAQVTAVLQQGLASPEHAAFIAKVEAAAGRPASSKARVGREYSLLPVGFIAVRICTVRTSRKRNPPGDRPLTYELSIEKAAQRSAASVPQPHQDRMIEAIAGLADSNRQLPRHL